MKTIFPLLSIFFCCCSLLYAQNPYVELSYPWLNLQQVKESKVKSIMLATMNSDNSKVEKQIALTFNQKGQMVKEECQIGFRFSNSLLYDGTGVIEKVVFSDYRFVDTIRYRYFTDEKKFVSQKMSKDSVRGWNIVEKHFIYNEEGLIFELGEYSGSVEQVKPIGENAIESATKMQVSRSKEKLIIISGKTTQTYYFNEKGFLQSVVNSNSIFGISEEYSYSYDQNDRLVMISWSQDGQSNKTFVTYEFYQ